MPHPERPIVKALPSDGRAWRIDWIGNLAFPNRLIRRTQPSVLLHFSPVEPDPYDSNDLLPPSSTNSQFQRKSWVSVGSLILFRIGDIWRNGQLEAQPDYQQETFEDLVIDNGTTTIIKAGLSPNESDFLLPLDEHPWHRQNTQSYCVMVELPDERRLIIPCYELIRFYFGSSSGLLAQLFRPPLKRDSLYSGHHFDGLTKHLQISLASNISGYSAADVGRIACDPVAWRAAAIIGASSVKASVSGLPIYPQALFPFEGKTTLTVSGKWLSFGDKPNATFIVYSLRSCSHPFPFTSLRYDTARSQSSTRMGTTQEPHRYGSTPDPSQQTLVERDASGKLARKTKRIQENVRFPDLLNKPVWKTKPLVTKKPESIVCNKAAIPINEIAVGDSGSVDRIRPVDLVVAQQSNHQMPDFLKPLVEYLRSLENVQVNLLTSSDEDGWTIPVPLVGDDDGVIDLAAFQIEEISGTRLKKMAFFEIQEAKTKVTVVAVEAKFDDCLQNYAVRCCSEIEPISNTLRAAVRKLLFPSNI